MFFKIDFNILAGDDSILNQGYCIIEAKNKQCAQDQLEELFMYNTYGDDTIEISEIRRVTEGFKYTERKNAFGIISMSSDYFWDYRVPEDKKSIQDFMKVKNTYKIYTQKGLILYGVVTEKTYKKILLQTEEVGIVEVEYKTIREIEQYINGESKGVHYYIQA